MLWRAQYNFGPLQQELRERGIGAARFRNKKGQIKAKFTMKICSNKSKKLCNFIKYCKFGLNFVKICCKRYYFLKYSKAKKWSNGRTLLLRANCFKIKGQIWLNWSFKGQMATLKGKDREKDRQGWGWGRSILN